MEKLMKKLMVCFGMTMFAVFVLAIPAKASDLSCYYEFTDGKACDVVCDAMVDEGTVSMRHMWYCIRHNSPAYSSTVSAMEDHYSNDGDWLCDACGHEMPDAPPSFDNTGTFQDWADMAKEAVYLTLDENKEVLIFTPLEDGKTIKINYTDDVIEKIKNIAIDQGFALDMLQIIQEPGEIEFNLDTDTYEYTGQPIYPDIRFSWPGIIYEMGCVDIEAPVHSNNIQPGIATLSITIRNTVTNKVYYIYEQNFTILPNEEEDESFGWKQDNVGWWYQNDDGSYPYNCWKEIDGEWYYFNTSGYRVEGWQSISGTWYYFDEETGIMYADEWLDNTYYLNASGAMATGWLELNDSWYYLESSGAKKIGWIYSGGTWYYAEPSTGVLLEEDWLADKYYFKDGGAMITGWGVVDGKDYHFTTNGKVTNKWVGSYWLGSDGVMATNAWVDNGKSYVNASGIYQTSWLLLDGNWYYLGTNGVLQKGWIQVGDTWYYGGTETGILYEEEWLNDTYYFHAGGAMATGWVLINGDYYCFANSGEKVVNKWVGNYYLKSDGVMAANEWIGNYYVGADGKWIPGYVG